MKQQIVLIGLPGAGKTTVGALVAEKLGCPFVDIDAVIVRRMQMPVSRIFAELGETGKLRVFDQLNDVRGMADLDAASFADIKRVIFGSDNDPYPDLPALDDQQAGVLVEVVKDLLYQVYVRKGRLQQAMMMRRFFADESIRSLAPPKNSQSG